MIAAAVNARELQAVGASLTDGGGVLLWKGCTPLPVEREASELDELKAVSRKADF